MKYYCKTLSSREMMLYARTNGALEGFDVVRIPANYIVESCKDRLFRIGCLASINGQFLTKKGKRNIGFAIK